MTLNWQGLDIVPSIKELGHIMAPAMLSQLLPPISSMLATKLVAGFGATAVAAWALGSRVEFFSIVVVLAMTMSMPPMIGRMLGAKEIGSIRTLVNIAVKFILLFQLSIAAILFVLASPIANLLSSEASVSEVFSMHLVWIPFSLGPLGVCMLMVSVCNALALPMRALWISSLRLFVCFLPMIWLGTQLFGLQGIFIGATLGNIAAGIMAWLLYQKAMQATQTSAMVTEK